MTSSKPVRLLTPDEAAQFLSVSQRTVKRWSLKAACVPIKFADPCASDWKILKPMLSKTIGRKIHAFCLVLSPFEQACHRVRKQ